MENGHRGKGMVPKNKILLYKDLMLEASGLFLLKKFLWILFFLQEKKYRKKKLSKSNERRITMEYGILLSSYVKHIIPLDLILLCGLGVLVVLYNKVMY